uniref:S1 motif domain-containing protein n=1 Tax=Chromulina nebulosa TaxID=96789 RepID=A0A7S0SQK5_9STRA|mmetsp:Transcript_1016/g.894  ORF Transcript_1016/g.894 Transcript_1016/m.894 type:complete len:404 (+) Transcript_1016:126-1337(+)
MLFIIAIVAVFISTSSLTNCFTHRAIVQTRQYRISMAAALVDRKDPLVNIKERYSGRADFVEISDEIEDYNFFAEADEEEIDPPSKGQTITGTVIEIDDNGALIEIGGKMSGYLPLKEASLTPLKNLNSVLTIGQELTGEIIGSLKGMPVMSLRSAQLIVAWEKALNYRVTDEVFEVEVVEVNRGGAVCDLFGLKAFLPGSHFLGTPSESLIGTTLKVKFLDANEEEGKLVVSQKRALSDNQSVDLIKNAVVGATVTGLRSYGVFLELDGGLAGLLHISQISFDRIDNLENLFSVGQKCKVMILDHDKVNNRVALSTKTLEANPGDMLRNMTAVFENAEETAKKYQQRIEAEKLAREAAAKDIVAGLGGAIDDANVDPLVSVADSIESILASIVSSSETKPNV